MANPVLFAAISLAVVLAADVGASTISTVCPPAGTCPVDGTLVLRSGAESRELPLVKGNATFDGPLDKWEAELRAPGFWMAKQPLAPTLEVWRTGTVRGRFTPAAAGEALPSSFQLVLASPPHPARSGPIARGTTVDCPVAESGAWSCEVPATALDVIVRAKTFTPHYKWDVAVKPAAVTDLGTMKLRKGGSVAAWLDTETVKRLTAPARAQLIRMTMPDASPFGSRLNEPVAEATFNPHGMAQLAPVAAGIYVLEITAPGFAPVRLPQIQVYEGKESALTRGVTLEPPVTLVLAVTPPADPSGKPWHLDVFRRNDFTSGADRTLQGSASELGIFEVPNQAPGKFRVDVEDAAGNTYASRELVVTGPGDAEQTIALRALTLRGLVSAARKPLAAQLLFGGNGGVEQITARSDAEGKFNVTLPRDGKWKIDVEAADEGVAASVTVTVAPDDSEIEVTLPDTDVAGWVVDASGSRVPNAQVMLRQADSATVVRRAAQDGSFRFRGVAPGTIYVSARDRRGDSGSVEVLASAGTPVMDVEVKLQGLGTISGMVFSDGQPVVGARVVGSTVAPGAKGSPAHNTVTDLEGRFELPIPATASELVLTVAAAGRTVQTYGVPTSNDTIRLELASVGGLLRLVTPPDATLLRLFYQNVPVPLHEMAAWAMARGQRFGETTRAFDIPSVAPGLYRFCVTRGGAVVCREGTLAPDGRLELAFE